MIIGRISGMLIFSSSSGEVVKRDPYNFISIGNGAMPSQISPKELRYEDELYA
jgi:hypothetical protein